MKKLLLLIVLLLVVPVVITQLRTTDPPRRFESVRLADVEFTEVTFTNKTQDLRLAGMLFVPDGDGPFPAAVIIHGSGTSVRDNGWYLTLTKHLQDNGIMVLLPDKRGSGESGGDWRVASFEDLATDSVAGVDFILEQQSRMVSSIGVIGLSQGGHIAPLVAGVTSDVDYVVNIVGAAVPMHEQLVYEENHNIREIGVLPGVSNVLAYPAAWSLIYLRQKSFWDAIGNFDPAPYWQELEVNALVLYGEDDTNVPSERSVKVLREIDNDRITVKTYPGSGHALESPVGEGDSIFRADALTNISTFVLSVERRTSP